MALYQYNGIPIQSIQSITNQNPRIRPQTHKQKETQRNLKTTKMEVSMPCRNWKLRKHTHYKQKY